MPFLRGSEDSLNWAASQASKLPVDVLKNSITGASANDGEFDTSTTTDAPSRTSASPSPVRVFTPEEGDAATRIAKQLKNGSAEYMHSEMQARVGIGLF